VGESINSTVVRAAVAQADAVRRGARWLRAIAAVVVVVAVVGSVLETFTIDQLGLADGKPNDVDARTIGDALLTVSFPLALAALLYGAALVLTHAAASLDVDAVRATDAAEG
jgi:hypothetical protein